MMVRPAELRKLRCGKVGDSIGQATTPVRLDWLSARRRSRMV
jgi:hypothetical protein